MATFNKDIQISISAKDKTQSGIAGAKKGLEGIASGFKAVGIASAAALGGISLFLKDSVQSANDQIRVNTQLESVLKSTKNAVGLTADEIKNMAGSMQSMTGIADDAIQTGQNMLLTFTNIGKDVFPDTTKIMLDMATAMNGGLTPSAEQLSNQAIQLGKALNDPMNGLTALSRVGVTFTEEQKKVIEGFVKQGDVVSAQKIILEELGREFGGSATAQTQTFSGQLNLLTASFGDLKEEIGMAVIPILLKFVETIKPGVEEVLKWAQANPELTKTIILATTAIAALGAAILVLSPIVSGLSMGITGLIVVVKALGTALLFLATNPVGLILTALAALATAAYLVYTNWETIRPKLVEFWNTVSGAISGAVNTAKNVVYGTFDSIKEKVSIVSEWLAGKVSAVLNFVNQIKNALSQIGSGNIVEGVTGIGAAVSGARADGGPVRSGSTYLVGERGPELFTASRSGTIIPNGSGGGDISINLGGVTISNAQDADALVDRVTNRLIREMKLAKKGLYA